MVPQQKLKKILMVTAVILAFVIGYALIVFEHPLRLDKSVPALLMAATCWALLSLSGLDLFDAHHKPGGHE